MNGSIIPLFFQAVPTTVTPPVPSTPTWEDILVIKVRVLINDTESPQVYTDERLQQIIVYAAVCVQAEIGFDTVYTIDIDNVTISPDPTLIGDDKFCTLVALKAACITDQSSYRNAALIGGVAAMAGPPMLGTNQYMAGFKGLVSFNCEAYERQKQGCQVGRRGETVLSPFISNSYDPLSL